LIYLATDKLGRPLAACAWLAVGLAVLDLSAAPGVAQTDGAVYLRGSLTGGGISRFAEDKWALVKARVRNDSDIDAVVRVVWSFSAEPRRQFVRRIWVPAASEREVAWPARLGRVPEGDRAATGRALLLAPDSDRKLDEKPGDVIVAKQDRVTALIYSPQIEEPVDGVQAVRNELELGETLKYVSHIERDGPRFTLGWEPIEVIVIGRESLSVDAAQRRALRRWLRAGGTLWVMLDRANSDVLRTLLGDDWAVDVIDQVTLNRVRFDPAPRARSIRLPANERACPVEITDERPMRMIRVVAPDYRVWLTVRRWPALLERRVGAGRIVVTTVAPRAWIAPATTTALQVIGRVVYDDQAGALSAVGPDVGRSFIQSQIGYRVAGRATIATVLGLYVALFAVAAMVLVLRGRAERIGLWGAGLSVAAGAVLLVIGTMQRGETQPTAAALQVVHVEPGSASATVRGTLGLFAPYPRTSALSSRSGGMAWPRDRFETGVTRRLMWTDLDLWEWRNLELSGAATLLLDVATTTQFDRALKLDCRFGPAGPTGTLDWPGTDPPRDMVLLTGQAAMRVELGPADPDGTQPLNIPADATLATGSYLGADLLSQTQQQRAQVIAELSQRRNWPPRPMLIGWTGRVEDGLGEDAQVARRGDAVWLVPFSPRPARPGETVRVPWPFVRWELLRGVEGIRASVTSWDPINQRFIETRTAGTLVARFTTPQAVWPLEPTGATLHLDISATGWSVDVLAVPEDQPPRVLATLPGPDGLSLIPIAGRDLAAAGDGRSITLAVRVGDPAGPVSPDRIASRLWRIKRLGLEITGIVGSETATHSIP
jgi:hypothetical protein